jgi:aspartate kinase
MSGELRANAGLSITLEAIGIPARSLTGREAGIMTSSGPVDGMISEMHIDHITELLEKRIVPVVAGFQGYYHDLAEGRDEVSILGRGGSNLTAVALAHALEQPDCTMFSNVDGIYDKDPNACDDAKKIDEVTAADLLTWDPFPHVIQKEAGEYAVEGSIDIWIRSGFDNDLTGTLIRCGE